MTISPWLSFIGGLIVGGLFGLFMGRRNYESCREQLAKMTKEIKVKHAELDAIETQIEAMQRTLDAKEERPSIEESDVKIAIPGEIQPEVGAKEEVSASPEIASFVGGVDAEKEAGETRSATASFSETEPEPVTTVSQCPQKLARIHGIGRVYEDKLYQAGIGTFWQVATASTEKLAEIFDIKDFQAVDLDAIKADARRLAEETGTVGHVWSGEKPDDFESLPGIGKTYEARLYDAGICTFEKLAELSEEELAAIIKAPKMRQPDYAAWIAYAREQRLKRR